MGQRRRGNKHAKSERENQSYNLKEWWEGEKKRKEKETRSGLKAGDKRIL